MPPKSRKQAEASNVEVDRDVSEENASLVSEALTPQYEAGPHDRPLTEASLEQIVASTARAVMEASRESMASLVASLPVAPSLSRTHIKPPRWSDEDVPYDYFTKFEKAMTHNRVGKCEWGHLLPIYLSGKAQASFSQVDDGILDDYDAVKETLLKSLGDTPASADRRWWTLSRQDGEAPGAFYLRVRSTGLRWLHGLMSHEQLVEKTILSRFLSLLPQDCYSSVVEKRPKNGLEASRLVHEWEETRGFAR